MLALRQQVIFCGVRVYVCVKVAGMQKYAQKYIPPHTFSFPTAGIRTAAMGQPLLVNVPQIKSIALLCRIVPSAGPAIRQGEAIASGGRSAQLQWICYTTASPLTTVCLILLPWLPHVCIYTAAFLVLPSVVKRPRLCPVHSVGKLKYSLS